jgi:hypothetical protein
MASNLKVEHYNDGSPIPIVTDNDAWAADTAGAMCWYNNIPDNSIPPITDEEMKYTITADISAAVTTDVTTALTTDQEPFSVMILDAASPKNDITSLVGKSWELVGGVWVLHIDSLNEYLGVEIKIIY